MFIFFRVSITHGLVLYLRELSKIGAAHIYSRAMTKSIR